MTEVDIWICRPEAVTDGERLRWCESLLDGQERERHARFYFPQDRQRFLVSHALVRCVLSRYESIDPADWRFVHTAEGQPLIDRRPGSGPLLHFNLTHTRDLAACIVGRGTAVGIDGESLDRDLKPFDLAPRVFSAAEMERMAALPTADEQHRRFLETWCLKEAYSKAIGLGLSAGFHTFTFSQTDTRPQLEIAGQRQSDWRFLAQHRDSRHLLAAAIQAPANEYVQVALHTIVPGCDPTSQEICILPPQGSSATES